jgi:D-alanyl-D-alanine carboxypeptidase
MFNSFLIYLLSFFFFSSCSLFPLPLNNFDHGEIINLDDSDVFSEKVDNLEYFDISADSLVVMDFDKETLILDKNSDQILSIASISKLMAALVLLDCDNLDLDDIYELEAKDRRIGGRDYLFIGDRVSNEDLLILSLIASDNTAIIALASSLGLSEEELVSKMNDRAKLMGLENTSFVDATGLEAGNVSTAREVASLLKESLNYSEIARILKKAEYKMLTEQGKEREIFSTNYLLEYDQDDRFEIKGGKTGYNFHSGYCLTVLFSMNNRNFISVVLNSSSLKNRFSDTLKIIDKVYNLYNN